MMVISFKKGMAYPFFPFPMNEISNSVVDADLVWGSEFGLLREQLLATVEVDRRFEIVEQFLLAKFRSKFVENECVAFAVNEMRARPDALGIAEMNRKIGYSQKHFVSLFAKHVGITPKAYLKIMRFQKAVCEIEKTADVDWTRLALDCGFYDQSHFINDFKLFSGFTPADYADRRRPEYLNYVPIG
jgi:AraC-like DNA-binding protein